MYDTSPSDASHLARFRLQFTDDIPLPPMIYGIGHDTTYNAVIQMLVKEDGSLDEDTLKLFQANELPFSLQTASIMDTLSHFGEALFMKLKAWKKTGSPDPTLMVVENTMQSLFGPDIQCSLLYASFLGDSNNSRFKIQVLKDYVPVQTPFPYYGSCLLVAFRNCTVHSGLRIAYEYFPGKDADIINLARALKNCSALSEITCFLHYL